MVRKAVRPSLLSRDCRRSSLTFLAGFETMWPCSTSQTKNRRTVTSARLMVATAWPRSRRRWSRKSSTSLFEIVLPGVGAGVLIGGAVGLVVGVVMGAAVGWHNEATLTGEEYEELFIGFGEYSMQGMAFWCAFIGMIYGAIAGGGSGAIAWTTRRRMAGLVVAITLPLFLWLETDLFHDQRNQAGFVWCASMLAGSGAAGLLCASQLGMSRGSAEPGTQIEESQQGTA